MSMVINGFNTKVIYLQENKIARSLYVELNIHPLQMPKHQITSLDHLCNGMTKWVNVGHTMSDFELEEHCFIVYGRFFDHGVPYIGVRKSIAESIIEIIKAIKPSFLRLALAPEFGGV